VVESGVSTSSTVPIRKELVAGIATLVAYGGSINQSNSTPIRTLAATNDLAGAQASTVSKALVSLLQPFLVICILTTFLLGPSFMLITPKEL